MPAIRKIPMPSNITKNIISIEKIIVMIFRYLAFCQRRMLRATSMEPAISSGTEIKGIIIVPITMKFPRDGLSPLGPPSHPSSILLTSAIS